MRATLEQLCISSKQPRVLTIDDNPQFRRTLCAMLTSWDLECFAARDGDEGFRRVVELRPDIVITDLIMPGFNGFAFLTMLQELRPPDRPSVIILSGSLDDVNTQRHPALKIADYLLAKPIKPQFLHDCLAHSLARRAQVWG